MNASVDGPKGIVRSILVSLAAGFVLLFGLTFAIQSYTGSLTSETGVPPAQIFMDALGASTGKVMLLIVIGAQLFCGMAYVTADSRMIYAFSRDGALPKRAHGGSLLVASSCAGLICRSFRVLNSNGCGCRASATRSRCSGGRHACARLTGPARVGGRTRRGSPCRFPAEVARPSRHQGAGQPAAAYTCQDRTNGRFPGCWCHLAVMRHSPPGARGVIGSGAGCRTGRGGKTHPACGRPGTDASPPCAD